MTCRRTTQKHTSDPLIDREYVAFEDLRLFLPAHEALAALKILDLDADGKICPNEMRDAVLHIYRERKYLASTLSVSF